MPLGKFRVIGKYRYRGHEPGAEFVANLRPDEKARAIARGSIEPLPMEEEKPKRTAPKPLKQQKRTAPKPHDPWSSFSRGT
jgi:hypothetical protein